MTQVLVDSWLRVQSPPGGLRDRLLLQTRMAHPDKERAARAGAVYRGPDIWTPCVQDGGDLLLPRGMLADLRRAADKSGVRLQFISRVRSFEPLKVPVEHLGMVPRPYQQDAVEVLHRRVQGVVVLPCGGGKTAIGAMAILTLGQPAIVLVHTTDLLDQWADTFRRMGAARLRVAGGGAQTDGGPLGLGEVLVATIGQVKGRRSILESAGVILVDECHHAPATQWAEVLSACPARWRWGLTATPERSDGWGHLIEQTIGPVLYERTTLELIADGYLRRPLIVPVAVPWTLPDSGYGWDVACPACGRVTTTTREKLTQGTTCRATKSCGARLDLSCESKRGKILWSAALSLWSASRECRDAIAGLAGAGLARGRLMLVLVPRKDLARHVAHSARSYGMDACAVTSDEAQRDALIRRFRSRDLDLLAGTQLADEGLDVADADMLIMASMGRAQGLAVQRGGRVCRPAGAGTPVIFDLVPDSLEYQWRDRRRAYVAAYGPDALFSAQPVSVAQATDVLEAADSI